MTVVGIDLGTTNTVIAAVREGRATALKDKLGRALLPSVVSFTPRGAAKVGHEAKARRTLDPENTIFSTKRLIGRSFDSEHVKKAITRLPFTLKEGPGHSVLVSAYGEDHTLAEISALVLKQAAEIAEARLGTGVTEAVITVPANFNDLQRAATKIAGRTAGLEVLRIINEPTAAALAYGFGKSGHERIAIYDFGGGTFDVTILDLNENVFEVLATAGDTFLGGDDIDQAIMDRMAEKLLAEQKVDAEKDNLVREQLRAAAEILKIDLSSRSLAKTRIEELEFDFTMRRSEFESLTEPFLAQTLKVCKEAMELAGIDNGDLDQVLLVGGSTRIPLVRRRISSFFGKMPQSRINPDEVVAIGAAIQASSLEARQRSASIPSAPSRSVSARRHPFSSTHPSPETAVGGTKTGLAGLNKTLAGVPAGGESSSLKSLQSITPAVSGIPLGGRKLGPAQTLSGVGGSLSPAPFTTQTDDPKAPLLAQTLTGFTAPPTATGDLPEASDREKGTTNLGLGVQPGFPLMTFDDVTAVAPSPDADAAALDREAARARLAKPPETGAAGEGEDEYEDYEDEVTDGSVTFDLASLGLGDDDVNELENIDEETTQIYKPASLQPESNIGDETQIDESENPALLPATTWSKLEEISDSALFSLDESDGENDADLPSPSLKRGAATNSDRISSSLQKETNLPAVVTASNRAAFSNEDDDLESTAVGHPPPHANLPVRVRRSDNLPSSKGNDLPSPKANNLPEVKSNARTRLGPLIARPTNTTTPESGKVQDLDFEEAIKNSPANSPNVDALDELSVATLLPTDESEDAFPLGLGSGATGIDIQAFDDFAPEATAELDPDEVEIPISGGRSFSPAAFLSDAVDRSVPDHQVTAKLPQGAPLTRDIPSRPQTAARSQPAPAFPLLLDVTPLSLGVEVSGGYVDRLIARNSPIPCQSTRTFATVRDNQPLVRVRVSQGENDRFNRNTLLGELELTGLPPGPRGSIKVDVSFSLDENGMLQVTARDVASGHVANARLTLVGVDESM